MARPPRLWSVHAIGSFPGQPPYTRERAVGGGDARGGGGDARVGGCELRGGGGELGPASRFRYSGPMCGRIVRTSPAEVLAAEFGAEPPAAADARPRWNLCPGEDLLIVVQKGEHRRMGTVRWGLVPWFAGGPDAGPRSVNARAEN